jgi:hypothetical protein
LKNKNRKKNHPYLISCPKSGGVVIVLLLRPLRTSEALKKGSNFRILKLCLQKLDIGLVRLVWKNCPVSNRQFVSRIVLYYVYFFYQKTLSFITFCHQLCLSTYKWGTSCYLVQSPKPFLFECLNKRTLFANINLHTKLVVVFTHC